MKPRNQFLENRVKPFLSQIKPSYSELTTYQAAITFILLLIVYPEILSNYHLMITKDMEAGASVTFILVLVGSFSFLMVGGIVLSIWHVFAQREKGKAEKFIMGAFAIFISGLAGLLATMEFLPDKWSILLVFPFWNLLWGILLLERLGAPQEAVTDEEANLGEVLAATIVVLLTFSVTVFSFQYSWPVVFSICTSTSSLIFLVYNKITAYFHKMEP